MIELKKIKYSNDRYVKLTRIQNNQYTKKAKAFTKQEFKQMLFNMLEPNYQFKINKHQISYERRERFIYGVLVGTYIGLRIESLTSTRLTAFSQVERPENQIDNVEKKYLHNNSKIFDLSVDFRMIDDLKVNFFP